MGGSPPADSGDEPVSFREIEAWVEADGHHGGRGFGGPDAGQDAEDAIFVEADVMVAGRERKDLVEVLALDPQLVFAGCVAGVFAAFEHGDHHDLDSEWFGFSCGLGKQQLGINTKYDQPKHN